MEELFIINRISLKLKKLGFNEPCFSYYENEEFSDTPREDDIKYQGDYKFDRHTNSYSSENECSAPTWEQGFNWFRKKYNLNGVITPDTFNDGLWEWKIDSIDKKIVLDPILQSNYWIRKGCFKTYEEARQDCLETLASINYETI